MRSKLGVVLALAHQLHLTQPSPPDAERWAWRYRREVTLDAEADATLAALDLPPDVAARCRRGLEDVRLVGPEGEEVPYVVDRGVRREAASSFAGRLVDSRREARRESVWVVDLGAPRSFDRLDLEVPDQEFAKGLRVEVSGDRRSWRTAVEDAGVFDRAWTTRIHHTTVTVPDGTSARYVRITADDRRSRPLDVTGVTAVAARPVGSQRWRRPIESSGPDTTGGVSRYRLGVPPGYPLESLALQADDAVFSRRAVVREVRDVNGRRTEVVLADGHVYRVRIEDPRLSGARLDLPVRRPDGGDLVLEIHDGDSPPLRGLEVSASGVVTRLIFTAPAAPLLLYYGNEATRAPRYDVARVEDRLALDSRFARAELGEESINRHFRTLPPLTFVPLLGSPVEVSGWRSLRRLSTTGREDLYTFTLAPVDLGWLRPDLGDLRIVDASDRQVPYVLEPAVSEARVVLTAETAEGKVPSSLTRHRLAVPGEAGVAPRPLPVATLELRFAESFFSRPARILAAPAPQARARERILFSGTIARTVRAGPDGSPGAARTEEDVPAIPLAGARIGEVALEIEDGDNAPLSLVEARAVVRVPRVAFRAGGGSYRLLLGNPAAEPPRYDIASLRQEVLAYSAVPVQASPAEPNPAFRRGPAHLVRQAPPALVLWVTLAAAVVALLLLTARIVRSSPE